MIKRIRPATFVSALVILPLLIWAISNWAVAFSELRRLYVNLPDWDYWDMVEHYPRYVSFDWKVFWVQHNEHRIVAPEIIFALDFVLFQGRQIFTTVMSVAAYAGVLVLFARAVLSDKVSDRPSCWAAILAAAVLVGWKGNAANLAIPFLAVWSLLEFSVVCSLACLVLHRQLARRRFLVGAIVSAVICTYTAANGLLFWPLMMAAALFLRLSKRALAAISVSGALSVALYFVKYRSLGSLDLAGLLAHPLYLAGFIGSFVGMPFSAIEAFTSPWWSNATGLFGIVMLLVTLLIALRTRTLATRPGITLCGFCLFTLISGAATAGGRMNPQDPYFQAARAVRYLTMPVLFWAALSIFNVWLVARFRSRYLALGIVVACALVLVGILPRLRPWYRLQEQYFQNKQWAALCAENGVMDKEANSLLFSDPDFIVKHISVLRDNRLAAFAGETPFWVGRKLSEILPVTPDAPARGMVTAIVPRENSFEIVGWAEADSAPYPLTVLFVDETGRIVGFGQRLPAGSPHLFSNDQPLSLAWTGFIGTQYHSREFEVYVLGRHARRLIPIGKWKALPVR